MSVKKYYPGMELPEQNNVEVSIGIALDKFKNIDPSQMIARLGCKKAEVDEKAGIEVIFMGSPVKVSWPEGHAYYPNGDKLPEFFRAFILHYLVSEGDKLEGELITFVQCPAGKVYEGPFNKMTKDVLLDTFGHKHELFLEVAKKLGWEILDRGDASAVAYPFPKVPMTFVLYSADDEFDADASVFFDKSVTSFIPQEDIKLTCGMMIGSAKKEAMKIEGE